MQRTRWARRIAVLTGLVYLASGAWAFFAPRSFFESLATFPPFNEHLIHDLGAFQVGLGLTVLLALRARALVAALTANAFAAVLHLASHVMDRDLGGRGSNPFLLGGFALLIALAAVLAARDHEVHFSRSRGM